MLILEHLFLVYFNNVCDAAINLTQKEKSKSGFEQNCFFSFFLTSSRVKYKISFDLKC